MFITFEGPKGCGKTTQISILASWLRSRGLRVLCTREPGGTLIGDQVRRILTESCRKAPGFSRGDIRRGGEAVSFSSGAQKNKFTIFLW